MIGYLLTTVGVVISAIALVLSTVLPAKLSRRADERAEEQKREEQERQEDLDRLKVESEAYQRAQRINDQIVEALKEEIDRLNAALVDVRAQLRVEQATTAALSARLAEMENRIARMRALLERHQIPLPD